MFKKFSLLFSAVAILIFSSALTAHASTTITSPTTATAVSGVPFSYQITATGFILEYHAWDMPDWLSINESAGILYGTPTSTGSVTIMVEVIDSESNVVTQDVVITIRAAQPPVIRNESSYNLVANGRFQLTASNTPDSYTSSTLPNGFALDSATGILSLTAVAQGSYPITFTASNFDGSDTKTITLTVVNSPFCNIDWDNSKEQIPVEFFDQLWTVKAPNFDDDSPIFNEINTDSISYSFCADFNNDGTGDLLNVYNGNYSYLAQVVYGWSLTSTYNINPPAGFSYVGVGDYDGDGDIDIFFAKNTRNKKKKYVTNIIVVRNDRNSFTNIEAPIIKLTTATPIVSAFVQQVGTTPVLTVSTKVTDKNGLTKYNLNSFSYKASNKTYSKATKTFGKKVYSSNYPVVLLSNIDGVLGKIEAVIGRDFNYNDRPRLIANVTSPNSTYSINNNSTSGRAYLPSLPK